MTDLVGKRVRVTMVYADLDPDYEGREGTVQRKEPDKGRWLVILDDSRSVSLYPHEFEVLDASNPVA